MAIGSKWSQLPAELILLVVEKGTMPDAVAFSQVCRAFRLLCEQRIFWITLLNAYRSRKSGPIDCPPHQDFALLSLDNLKSLAFGALSIRSNFQRAHRQHDAVNPPVLSLQMVPGSEFQCPTNSHMLTFIAATDLILFSNPTGVSCWNMRKGTEVSSIQLGGLFVRSGEEFEEPGRMLFVVERKPEDPSFPHLSIAIIAVDYVDLESPSLTLIHRNDQIPVVIYDMSLSSTIWAFTSSLNPLSVTAVNLQSGREHTISTDIFVDDLMMMRLLPNALHIFVLDEERSFDIYHLPRDFLPYDDNPKPLTSFSSDGNTGWTAAVRPETEGQEEATEEAETPDNFVLSATYIPEWETVVSLNASGSFNSGLSMAFVQYKSKDQFRRWQINFPSNLEYEVSSCGLAVSKPWRTTSITLCDEERLLPKVHHLLRFDPERPTIMALQRLRFPDGLDQENFTHDGFDFDDGKGELLLVGKDHKVLRLSYLQTLAGP